MSNPKYYHPETDSLRKLDLPPPEAITHGTEEDIRKKLEPLQMSGYTLEGNRLIAHTELGDVVNFLPTNYILRGVDKKGHPILDKIKV